MILLLLVTSCHRWSQRRWRYTIKLVSILSLLHDFNCIEISRSAFMTSKVFSGFIYWTVDINNLLSPYTIRFIVLNIFNIRQLA